MSTDWHTATLHAYEAREDRLTRDMEIAYANVVREWNANPEDCAREAIQDGALYDVPVVLDIICKLAALGHTSDNTPADYREGGILISKLAVALRAYQADQRMGEDDG